MLLGCILTSVHLMARTVHHFVLTHAHVFLHYLKTSGIFQEFNLLHVFQNRISRNQIYIMTLCLFDKPMKM